MKVSINARTSATTAFIAGKLQSAGFAVYSEGKFVCSDSIERSELGALMSAAME